MTRKILVIAATVVVVLVAIAVKVHVAGSADYRRAKQMADAGDVWGAIHAFDRALHWYTPFSGYIRDSAENLWAIGQAAENRDDSEQALTAYRTLRSGFYAARSFYTPGKEWIAKCDERIVALASKQADFVERHADLSAAEREERVAGYLRKDRAPDVFWSIVVEIGFFGWVVVALLFIWRVLGAEGGWNRGRAAKYGVATLVFYAMWVVGLLKA